MFKGWFKVHRLMLENDLWLAEKFTMGQAWVDLIGHANHKPGSVWIRGIEVKVNRGQIAWSELTMAHRWKWSRGKVRRYLGTLETRQMIVQQKSNQTSLVTICKYEVYQGGDTSESIPGDTADDTPSSTPDEHQTVHKQECNNVENEENKDKDSVPTKVGTSKYSDEFEIVWQGRVKREGNDPKAGAYKCWKANIKRGVTPDAMVEGIERYRKHCEAKGIVGTEMVQMLQTFLGPNENFTQDWAINQGVQTNGKHRGFNGQGHQPISDPDDTSWAEGFDPRAGDFEDL
jgi:hypothetical protein